MYLPEREIAKVMRHAREAASFFLVAPLVRVVSWKRPSGDFDVVPYPSYRLPNRKNFKFPITGEQFCNNLIWRV